MLAKMIGDVATGQTEDLKHDLNDATASQPRRRGGLKGGKARAKKLTAEQRVEIALVAAAARWKK